MQGQNDGYPVDNMIDNKQVPRPLNSGLSAPREGRVDLLVVAGEHSGDEHAGRMVRGLLCEQPDLKVAALGGQHLEAAGVQLLHDLTVSSVVGVFEVLKSFLFFRELFAKILEWIREYRPRAICLVDYPGLNLQIARKLYREGISRKGGGEMWVFYYISPQVWAWKARRRFDMARWLDGLGVIFPFEEEVFGDTGLDVQFVGHPFMADGYRNPLRNDPSGPVLLLPGSRRTAVSRIFPLLLEAFASFRKRFPKARAVTLFPSGEIRDLLQGMIPAGLPVDMIPSSEGCTARAVLTSSGTMSLTCALAGIPGAIAYRANPLTYLMGKALVEVPFLGIANLLLQKPMYPEFIQGEATAPRLAEELFACVDEKRGWLTMENADHLRDMLSQPPNLSASRWLGRVLS
jgi:lipid-A-disaccharide synthase